MHPYLSHAGVEQHRAALLADAEHARQVRTARTARRTPRQRRWWEPLFTHRAPRPARPSTRPAVA